MNGINKKKGYNVGSIVARIDISIFSYFSNHKNEAN